MSFEDISQTHTEGTKQETAKIESVEGFTDSAISQNCEHLKRLEQRADAPNLRKRLGIFAVTSLIALGIAKDAQAQSQETAPKEVQTEESVFDTSKYKTEFEEKAKAAFQKMQKIENSGLRDKYNLLKKKYGVALNEFSTWHAIERSFDTYDRVISEKNNGNPNVFVNQKNPFLVTEGSLLKRDVEKYWNKKETREINGKVKISGFQEGFGMDDEELLKELDSRYPRGFLQRTVSEIVFVSEVNPEGRDGLFIAGQAESFGISAMARTDNRIPIKIYKNPHIQSKDAIFDVIDHEIAGHGSDWMNDRLFSNDERIEFLHEISEAYERGDRYKSDYVENLIEAPDPQIKDYKKIREYWAEIVAEMHGPKADKFRESHKVEAGLYNKWFNAGAK